MNRKSLTGKVFIVRTTELALIWHHLYIINTSQVPRPVCMYKGHMATYMNVKADISTLSPEGIVCTQPNHL